MDENVRYLSPAPLYHAAPLRYNMAVMRHGGTSVIMEHFDLEEAPGPYRKAPADPRPIRADHVRTHAEAAPKRIGSAKMLQA